MRHHLFLMLLLLLPWSASAAEIVGPDTPVPAGQYVTLTVQGIPQEILPAAVFDYAPKDGSTAIAAQTWGGVPIILFRPQKAGTEYKLRIDVNAWVDVVNRAHDAAKTAKADPELLDRFQDLVNEVNRTHPFAQTEFLLKTAGTAPTDPTLPGPSDPPDPDQPRKIDKVTYIYEKDDTAVPIPVQRALQRLNREYLVLATIFEEDSTDAGGGVPEQYKIALEAARRAGLPALVVQAGDRVWKVVKNPTTETQVMEAATNPGAK